jgi:tRNA A58 N-methylase Trm61
VYPDVRPPTINGVYLLEYAEINDGEEVLDIGTGSGLHAVFAAEKAKRVVATDIYAPAVENARANARLHGVENKIDFRVGDLFEPIHDGEKFDVFFVNINFPFSNSNEKRNKLHERLFSEIGKYMKPDARIYYQTSFIRNIPYIYDMLSRNYLVIKKVHMEHLLQTRHEPLFIMVQSSKIP